MPHDVGLAVVGAKGYSRTHLGYVQILSEMGRGHLVASMMIDRDDHPDLVAQFQAQGVEILDDYQAMLDACHGRVDVVTLPVPIYLHAPMAIAALQAGYHVLVEKPVAGSLAEVDELIAARDRSGRQCAVGFQQLYSPAFQALKARIVSGELGAVRSAACMALWPRGPAYYGRNEWAGCLTCRGRPVFDSPFNNALAHQIMNLLYLATPEPDAAADVVELEAELYRAYDIESFDTGWLRARTREGAQIRFAATHACGRLVDPLIHIETERAVVDWQIRDNVTIRYADGRTETLVEDQPGKHMILNVADMVTGAVPRPHCTPEVGRAHAACIALLHQTTPIRTVAGRFVSTAADGQRLIAGVEQAVETFYHTGRPFSESAPFAREDA